MKKKDAAVGHVNLNADRISMMSLDTPWTEVWIPLSHVHCSLYAAQHARMHKAKLIIHSQLLLCHVDFSVSGTKDICSIACSQRYPDGESTREQAGEILRFRERAIC